MIDLNNIVRKNIFDLKAYPSARHENESGAAIWLDANENPYETAYNRYPDPFQADVKHELGKVKDIQPSQIFLGNGSDEVLDVLMRVFCEPGKDNVIIMPPTFGMYKVLANINDIKLVEVPLTKQLDIDTEAVLKAADDITKIIFVCSPNNPTGNLMSTGAIEKLLRNFNGIVAVDEAYVDFSESNSLINLLDTYDNLLISQTFSKAWGLAGARLGMAFASKEVIEYMNKVKYPYNVNSHTQSLVIEALKNNELEANISTLLNEKSKLEDALNGFECVEEILPSDANFLLVKFKNSKQVFDKLIEQGISVRDRSKELYCENGLRITIGTEDENIKVIETLSKMN